MSSQYSTYYPDAAQDGERRGGWHTVNVGHLVMGLAFIGLVVVWAVVQGDLVPDDDIRWLLPLPWVVAGAAGLIASAVAGGLRWRRSAAPVQTPAAPPAYDEPIIPDHTSDLDEKLARYDTANDVTPEEKP